MVISKTKIPYQQNFNHNDYKLAHIEDLIESKRNMLLNKQKKIKFIIKHNSFLDAVKNDYITYYNYISQQKQDQIKALELLNQYIHDLSVSGELSNHDIENSKFEQQRILHEIQSIKKGLDDIIKNTKQLNS